ncbi:hypothetical protein VTK26DRAFT_1631 [Humicola hyalothermophila]
MSPTPRVLEETDQQKRHCWECRRRYLVCDSSKPTCARCSASGVVCPGYGPVKPTQLRWLAPGRVAFRRRKKKEPQNQSGEEGREVTEPSLPPPVPPPTDAVTVQCDDMNIDLGALLPQAANYFNAAIYHDIVPVRQLYSGGNPHIYLITPSIVKKGLTQPKYIQLGTVCMTLSHRMNRTRSADLAERFYLLRGAAIRALREHLERVDHHLIADATITGIVTLLLADIQQNASLNWRIHIEGASKIIQLRGGYAALAAMPHMSPQIHCLYYTAVNGNTTCPASQLTMTRAHLNMFNVLFQQAECYYTSPFQMCPPALFAEIVKINHLRKRALETANAANTPPAEVNGNTKAASKNHTEEAYQLLASINLFSPEQWAEPKPSHQRDWALIGDIHRSAVALYCISSLQSLSVLPESNILLDSQLATHVSRLRTMLAGGLASPRVKRFTLWPLVVLGVVEAGGADSGSEAARTFVAEQLDALSRGLGTYGPLTAKRVLERFWAKGGRGGWDECFAERPYVFTAQVAVDSIGVEGG